MNRRDLFWLAIIIALIAGAIWIITNPQYPARPGLDLQGGLQVLLAADVPESRDLDAGEMDTARQIISQRINAIGVVEPLNAIASRNEMWPKCCFHQSKTLHAN